MVDGSAGRMRMVARAIIGLPGETHAQVAEAYGCKVGPKMLMDTQCMIRAAKVAGDNRLHFPDGVPTMVSSAWCRHVVLRAAAKAAVVGLQKPPRQRYVDCTNWLLAGSPCPHSVAFPMWCGS